MERLEQMIDITREIEEEKSEYRTVTSYLNDVQKLEDLPEPEKKKIADVAQNVVQLNSARNIFLNSEKKTDRCTVYAASAGRKNHAGCNQTP